MSILCAVYGALLTSLDHQDECLVEMRLYVPPGHVLAPEEDEDADTAAGVLQQEILEASGLRANAGDAIVTINELNFLTPRYDDRCLSSTRQLTTCVVCSQRPIQRGNARHILADAWTLIRLQDQVRSTRIDRTSTSHICSAHHGRSGEVLMQRRRAHTTPLT